jgi:hypothetical protein
MTRAFTQIFTAVVALVIFMSSIPPPESHVLGWGFLLCVGALGMWIGDIAYRALKS